MTSSSLKLAVLACLATLPAAACKTMETEPSEERLRTITVERAVPVPCPALAALGPEPIYADTDEAIVAASNPAKRAKLYVEGRAQRIKRLAEYVTAKLSCEF